MFSRVFWCALCSLGDACDERTQELSDRLTQAAGPQKQRAPQIPAHEVVAKLEAALIENGSDVDLVEFAAAVEQQLYPLEALGAWTAIAAREVKSNLHMVMQSDAVRKAGEAPRLREVLEAERMAGLHRVKPNGTTICANGSAALALVWLSRFLLLWVDCLSEPRAPTYKENVMRAYTAHISPYHTWLLKKAFKVATALVPSWGEAYDLMSECDAEGEAGVLREIAALSPILAVIESTLKEFQMWDDQRV